MSRPPSPDTPLCPHCGGRMAADRFLASGERQYKCNLCGRRHPAGRPGRPRGGESRWTRWREHKRERNGEGT